MIVADIHEQLLDTMQQAGIEYLTKRQFTLGNVESVQAFHEMEHDVMGCVYCNGVERHDDDCLNPAVHLVEMTINGAIARLKEEEGK